MAISLFRIITTLLFLNFTITYSQEIPPIQNYTAEIYNAENQNWSISQSKNNFIYAANNQGLLEFNGAEWNLFPSPNNSIIRSVKVIEDKIYTGCYMSFGFWEKDDTGLLTYNPISTSEKISLLEDEEFWNIVQLDEWVLFQSLNRIYIYNTLNDTFKIINSETVLEKIFKVNKTIYYQKNNDGLYKIEKGNGILVTDSSIIKNNIIVGIFSHKKRTILLTQEKGFFELKDNNLVKWKTNSDSLLSSISIYSSIETQDHSFILGSISNGLFQLDNEGNTILSIDQEKGLNNNTVLNIFEDIEKNIWVGLDNGISCLNFNSKFKVYNDKNGKLGTTYTSIQHKEHLYLGTNQGLYYKKTNKNNNFTLIEGTAGQVWNLQIIDSTLFCGHNSGTYIVNENQAKKIASIQGTWKLEQHPTNKNLIFQGNYTGINILKKTNNNWSHSHFIKGFENSSRYFEIINENKIIVTHEYKGLFELTLNNEATEFTEVNIYTKMKGEKSSLVKYQNDFLYFYEKGVFKYDINSQKFTIDNYLTTPLTEKETYSSGKLVRTIDNKLWAFTDKNILMVSPGKLNNTPEIKKIYLPTELRKDHPGFENITHIKEDKHLLGTSYGYLIIDSEKLKLSKDKIQLNKITKNTLNNAKKTVSLNDDKSFEYASNNIDFYLSVPNYEKFTEVNYKYILEGRHSDWSEWKQEPNISFKNLPYGEYTFKAKAKIGNFESTNTIYYRFEILRPWYKSNLFIILYFTLFVIIILITHSLNKRHYKKQKKLLILKKQREFERTQLENEKVIMKLRNDKLRNDIEGKNRELAASTMSIIKKNEFLNSIKKELSELKNNENIKTVIKIIDKNLNNNSDWKLFQEAFNNVDKEFLTKIKDKYPKLTPNDLRLCAYLRLNLSSKEIAPLLNISHKSVEIKRYRLRKKMGLEKKDNLIHHILEV